MEDFVNIDVNLSDFEINFLEEEAIKNNTTVNDIIVNILKSYISFFEDYNKENDNPGS